MTDTMIGKLITATAPNRRPVRGVILPPRGRSTTLRITVDGKPPKRFDPDAWTVTVQAGPVYGYGELPAEHLATKTMLRTEMRLQPVDEHDVIAEYKVRKGTVPLYAVADAQPMPALGTARAAAWTKARTCIRCNDTRPRPIPDSPEGDRYCGPCHQDAALERWAEQSKRAQAIAAEWARGVLADPTAVLIASTGSMSIADIRAETIAGDVLFDVRYRSFSDLDGVTHTSPEREAEFRAKYAGTVGPSETGPLLEQLAGQRLIGWRDRVNLFYPWGANNVAQGDGLSTHLALWSGQTPAYRAGYWWPDPTAGNWHWYPVRFKPYNDYSDDREATPAKCIKGLRTLLDTMAWIPAPQPHQPPEPMKPRTITTTRRRYS